MTPSMETMAPTIIFRMGHSLVLLKGRTDVSVPDNLALGNIKVLASGAVPSMNAKRRVKESS